MKPTRQTLEEADRAELVYQYVLAQLGAKTTSEVLALWQDIAPGQAAQTASTWLSGAIERILTRRFQARELAIAYYRMARALRTGTTIGSPFKEDEPERVSLEMLRQEFEALVAEHTGEGSTEVTAQAEPSGDDDSVEVESINGLSESLADDEAATEPYVDQLLTEMADAASKVIDDLDPKMSNADARASAKTLHLQHGAMIAAAGARTAMNGGRHATNQASARDPRVIGWVRQSSTGSPCYFCAMLISRRVLYKSTFTAGTGPRDDGRIFLGDGMFKFHDNCKCVAEPVYSDEDFATNPKYAENRKYADLWDRFIKDKYSGTDAINEWRKLLKRIRANETKQAAQAAA